MHNQEEKTKKTFAKKKKKEKKKKISESEMDRQNRVGSKHGGMTSASESNVDRRERLRKLALETIDLKTDPYIMRNHLGSYECKLCLTLHSNEGSYLAHTQGKKHTANLAMRAAKDARDAGFMMTQNGTMVQQGQMPMQVPIAKKQVIKIGRPGFKVLKIRDPITQLFGLLFQIQYPQIAADTVPRYRFMSAFEQRIEAPQRQFQYLLVAAEPYETLGFKIQALEIDTTEDRFWSHWDEELKQYTLQFFYAKGQLPGA